MLRRRRRHPGVVKVMTPGEPSAVGARSGRQDEPLHVPPRPPAERPRPLCQPADRPRDRRDARGRDGRRRAALAELRGGAGPHRSRRPAKASCRPPSASAARPTSRKATSRPDWRPPATTDRGDLRDACPVSQRHGAARHRGGLGWRHADRRYAEPGASPWRRRALAGFFGIPPENVTIRSPFLGGGFGSKGSISGPQILGILAARLVGKPVKLVLRREQMYGPVGHRAPTRQTAADRAQSRRTADRAASPRAHGDEHVRRLLRTCRRRLAYALCEPRDQDVLRGRPPRYRHAAVHACAGRGDGLDRAGERNRRDGRWPAAWIRSISGSRTMPRPSR